MAAEKKKKDGEAPDTTENRPKGAFLPVFAPIDHPSGKAGQAQKPGEPDTHWRKRW